jgi:hypothetical protein
MTNPTTKADIRDGGAPFPLPGGDWAAIVEPVRQPVTPELLLCQAVLEQAMHDLDRAQRLTPRRRATESAKLLRWFRSSDVRWPFSFESICATIGLDADAVRAAVLVAYPKAPPLRRVLVGDERLSA